MILNVAFKGTGNSSNRLVSGLSGEKVYLTNSFVGLKRDIYSIKGDYSTIYMFGLDKSLRGSVRIEQCATLNGEVLSSVLDINTIAQNLNEHGIVSDVCCVPQHSLCNSAYWFMLKKYAGRVVFFHIPSTKYITEDFVNRVQSVL